MNWEFELSQDIIHHKIRSYKKISEVIFHMWMCQAGLTFLSHGNWPAIKKKYGLFIWKQHPLLITPLCRAQTHKVFKLLGINIASLLHRIASPTVYETHSYRSVKHVVYVLYVWHEDEGNFIIEVVLHNDKVTMCSTHQWGYVFTHFSYLAAELQFWFPLNLMMNWAKKDSIQLWGWSETFLSPKFLVWCLIFVYFTYSTLFRLQQTAI